MDRKGIRGTVKLQAQVMVDHGVDRPTLLELENSAALVRCCKEKMLEKIKSNAAELTLDDVIFEEITYPVV